MLARRILLNVVLISLLAALVFAATTLFLGSALSFLPAALAKSKTAAIYDKKEKKIGKVKKTRKGNTSSTTLTYFKPKLTITFDLEMTDKSDRSSFQCSNKEKAVKLELTVPAKRGSAGTIELSVDKNVIWSRKDHDAHEVDPRFVLAAYLRKNALLPKEQASTAIHTCYLVLENQTKIQFVKDANHELLKVETPKK